MSSFYGGKQGRTYNIVARFDEIYINMSELTQLINELILHAGDRFTYGGKAYLVLPGSHSITEQITITTNSLTDPTQVVEIKGMVNEFSKGGSYTEANYGQYVIIDTILNENHRNDSANGILYRRGFDYNQEIAANRPKRTDSEFYDEIYDEQSGLTDRTFNVDRWVAAWRNYIINPGAGAIYVGQIVGPEGNAPELHATSWENIQENGESIINEMDVVPGVEQDEETGNWIHHTRYKFGSYSIEDKDGNITGAYIGFQIPYPVIEIQGRAISAYGESIDFTNQTGESASYTVTYDPETKDYSDLLFLHGSTGPAADKPFYYSYHIAIPKGIHGNDIVQFEILTGREIKNKLYFYIGEFIEIDQESINDNEQTTILTTQDLQIIAAQYLEEYADQITIEEAETIQKILEINDDYLYLIYYLRTYKDSEIGKISFPFGVWEYNLINDIILSTESDRTNIPLEKPDGEESSSRTESLNVQVGNLFALDNSKQYYLLCVKGGNITNYLDVSQDEHLANQAYKENIGYEINLNDTIWQVIKIGIPSSDTITFSYTADENDSYSIKNIDHIFTDKDNNIYAVYSNDKDNPEFIAKLNDIERIEQNEDDGKINIVLTNGSIFSFGYTSIQSISLDSNITHPQNIVVTYKQKEPLQEGEETRVNITEIVGNLNTVKAITKVGDNLAVLYSDPDYRSALTIGKTSGKDYYRLNYTDGDIDYGLQTWANLGSIGSQYHVFGQFASFEALQEQYPHGLQYEYINNDYILQNPNRAGWIVSIPNNNTGVNNLYAFDYQINSLTGNPKGWYKLKEIISDDLDINPKRIILLETEDPIDSSIPYTPGETDPLDVNGMWFVETTEDEANGKFRYN